jgi:hypothetical protein
MIERAFRANTGPGVEMVLDKNAFPMRDGALLGHGVPLRGNIEGYLAAGSACKCLKVHSGNHFTPFYSRHGHALPLDLQRFA